MKFLENVNNGTRNRQLHFGGDSDHQLDPGILQRIFIIALTNNIGACSVDIE